MNTSRLSGAECSDYGAHESNHDLPVTVWASLIATALLWCVWKAVWP